MLLQAPRSQLLVVDIQARLMPAVADADRVVRNTLILLQAAARLGLPVTVTEQYPKGLGATVPAVAEALPADAVVLPKIHFSAAADPAIATRVASLGRPQVVIAGAEAHVCVLQTAIGLKERGLDMFVVGDASSSRVQASASAAHARLLHAGIPWITTEMAVFEWLGQAGTDDFRALSALIK
jgi:nicotinamidase-related amidase